jgi:hypothetical protein
MRALLFFSAWWLLPVAIASPTAQVPEANPPTQPVGPKGVASPDVVAPATLEATKPAAPGRAPSGAAPKAPAANSQCKFIPGQQGWPNEQDWAQLNTTVNGRLLKPPPPGSACFETSENFNEDECDDVRRGFKDSQWHAENPISNMWQNYNNYSCIPDGKSCSGSGFPVYVVKAQTATDVKAAVDFAREKNIRLNIKSTGHDFLGR